MGRFILNVLLLVAGIILPFEILYRLNYDPQITGSSMFDAKMMRVNRKHIERVDVMAMGSSITLYELDSRMMVQAFNRPYYNFAAWGMQMSDMNLMLKPLTQRYTPKCVVMCSSVGDFMWPSLQQYTNYTEAPAFVRNVMPSLFFIKKLTAIPYVIKRTHDEYQLDNDAWGGARIKVPPANVKIPQLPFPTASTPGAYRSLDSLAAMLQAKHIRFIFIQAPIGKTGKDSARVTRYRYHFNRCTAIVKQHGGYYFNCYNTAVFPDTLFTDSYHMKPEGAIILSKLVIPKIKPILDALPK